jgi:hypothetical protein
MPHHFGEYGMFLTQKEKAHSPITAKKLLSFTNERSFV